MNYKGYTAQIEVDVEAGILFGQVLDINDVITFKGKTVEEIRQEFKNSIDDYLEFCQELGLSDKTWGSASVLARYPNRYFLY